MGLDLDVERRVLVDLAHRAGEPLARLGPVFAIDVVGADGERDRRGLGRLLRTEVLVEEVCVLDRLVFLAEAEAEHGGVGERFRSLLRAGVRDGELLVPVGRLVVDGDRLVVTADLVDGLLRELGRVEVVLRVDQDLANGDRLGDEARRLEGAGRVVQDLVVASARGLLRFARAFAILLPQLEVRLRALLVLLRSLGAAGVGRLDEGLRLQTLDVALDAEEGAALLGVLLLFAALAVEIDELRDVVGHVVEARRVARLDVVGEHVERLEVELRRVDPDVFVGVVQRDVAEGERGLFPVLRLEVRTRAGVLDLDVVVVGLFVTRRRLDVTDVAVEGRDHALLVVGEVFRSELRLLRRLRLALFALAAGEVAAALLGGAVLVHLGVDVLVTEHRRVCSFGRRGARGILGDDGVERRSALGPILLEVEKVGHLVLDLEDVRPVLLHDAGELELGEVFLLERLDEVVVDLRGERHRLLVAGAAHAAGADGLEVPGHRRLGEQIGGHVRALELRVAGLVVGDELVVGVELAVQLAHDEVLVAGLHRERRLGDVTLIHAGLRAAIAVLQVGVEDDALGVVAGVEVALPEIVHELERLLGVHAAVTGERLDEVVGALRIAREGVDRDDVAAGRGGELLGVRQRRVLRAVVDRFLQLAHRAREVALVPVDVAELVVGVAPHLVLGRRVLDDLGVRLLGEGPLGRITLRFVEEELAEREVRVGDELGVGPALDELEVDLAGLVEVERLLVLVREVVQHLVGAAGALRRVRRVVVLAPLRVLILEVRVVLDRRLPRSAEDLVGLASLGREARGLRRVLLLGLVGLHAALGLVAERRRLELDVALREAAHQLRPIRRVLRRRGVEALETLNFGHQELARPRGQPVAALVALRRVHRRGGVARLELQVPLLEVDRRRRRLEADLRLLAGGRFELAPRTGRQRFFRSRRNAHVGCRRRSRHHHGAGGHRQGARGPAECAQQDRVPMLRLHTQPFTLKTDRRIHGVTCSRTSTRRPGGRSPARRASIRR